MIRRLKDSTLSQGLTLLINSRIKSYGKVLNLKVDSKQKNIELEILLKGEKEPIQVTVNEYEVIEEKGHWYLLAQEIVTSREWINIVAENFLKGQRFEIPEQYAKMLKLVL
ncbi:hypothetical protein [Nitratifractor salsuginis]|uniref:Uncharacterized protein n=1 Tax=Nitratifractor salsuginis (strain DSM 16511 / JCM 12458 / E9I37-1) TaxID=749222 RepID=E6WYY3_NITSE|nr:hypothetical protein [Nitratifractor salsuginis]ADV46569.1 hypothetical protein Nitsa_1318 [Nitratifractor salsuginis DSM 16511]